MQEQSERRRELPSVLISGASFAGLAAAWWMVRSGYRVTIVELARDLKKGGTPVDIREGVVEVVRRMGLLERIATSSLPPRPMAFLDAAGCPIGGMPSREEGEGEGYEIERDVLLQMLFNEVKDDVEFLFADSILALEQSPHDVAVSFAGGIRRGFALVLGCDGTHSAVRRLCFGEEARYSLFMQCYFALTIAGKLLIEQDTAQMFNVPGRTVMLSEYKGKTDIGFCFFSEAEIAYDRRDQQQQKRLIREHFTGEGWRVGELLEELAGGDNFYFDKLCQIRMDTWSKGRVALVGDAAYCPSPAAGMGGSMAILGAAALGEAMQKYPGDLARAFADYDQSFRPVAETIQSDAIAFGMEMVMLRTAEAIEQRNQRLASGEGG